MQQPCRYDYAYARTDSGSDSHSVARLSLNRACADYVVR